MIGNDQAPFDIAASARAFSARQARLRAEREARRQVAWQAACQAVATLLPEYPSVRRAYLFGSVTRSGAFRADSDIDIALEGSSPADHFAIWRRLEETLPDWTLDVREVSVDTWLAERVRLEGHLIYDRAIGHTQS